MFKKVVVFILATGVIACSCKTFPIPLPDFHWPGRQVSLSALHMSDTLTGWGIDNKGQILRTLDGGHTWRNVTPSRDQYRDQNFYSLDSTRAWAVPGILPEGDNAVEVPAKITVWYTTDGGLSWLPGLLCVDGNCNDSNKVTAEFFVIRTLQFVDQKNGWILASTGGPRAKDRSGNIFSVNFQIYRTRNGGKDWMPVGGNLPWNDLKRLVIGSPVLGGAVDIAFVDADNGLIGFSELSAGDEDYYGSPANFIVTDDGGNQWKAATRLSKPDLPDEITTRKGICNTEKIEAVVPDGYYGTFVCRTDFPYRYYQFHFWMHSSYSGNEWLGQPPREYSAAAVLKFRNEHQGWRINADAHGVFLLEKTVDIGNSWKFIGYVEELIDLEFATENDGWALVKRDGTITLVRTTDGGRTWSELNPILSP